MSRADGLIVIDIERYWADEQAHRIADQILDTHRIHRGKAFRIEADEAGALVESYVTEPGDWRRPILVRWGCAISPAPSMDCPSCTSIVRMRRHYPTPGADRA